MSPEHVSSTFLRPTSDVYSLGCVAFAMLTGQCYVKVRARVEGPAELRTEVPPWLNEIVKRMLVQEPGLRPEEAGDVRKRFVDMSQVIDCILCGWEKQEAAQRAMQHALHAWQVDASGWHTCVITAEDGKNDGIKCRGANLWGQLGNGRQAYATRWWSPVVGLESGVHSIAGATCTRAR